MSPKAPLQVKYAVNLQNFQQAVRAFRKLNLYTVL